MRDDLGHALPFLLKPLHTPVHLVRKKTHRRLVRTVHDSLGRLVLDTHHDLRALRLRTRCLPS